MEFECEVRELRVANEILKKASAHSAMPQLDRPFRKQLLSLMNIARCMGSSRRSGHLAAAT